MPFTPEHDEWIREGLRDATFSLQVVRAGKGAAPWAQWGSVEEMPVDVYHCNFWQYHPPPGFPRHDVCCIRTESAWWIILTEAVHERLQTLAQAGELTQGLQQTIALINERHIGAWLLVRDQGMSGEMALAHMDRTLAERKGDALRDVHCVFSPEDAPDAHGLEFEDDDFGKEPLDLESLEEDILAFEPAVDDSVDLSPKRAWLDLVSCALPRRSVFPQVRTLTWMVLFVFVLVMEGPRLGRLCGEVYGPEPVELTEYFPDIRWTDRTSESIFQTPSVARAFYQALTFCSPVRTRVPVTAVSVKDGLHDDGRKRYRWTIMLDETAAQREVTLDTRGLAGSGMRALQNELSGYQDLRWVLAGRLFLKWGHQGRFILLCTGLCVLGLGLLVRRVVRQAQRMQSGAAIQDVAAGGKILESLSQDAHAAENLMLFNQQRRLRDPGALKPWEQETFAWVDHNVDPRTGKTRRKKRDDALNKELNGKA